MSVFEVYVDTDHHCYPILVKDEQKFLRALKKKTGRNIVIRIEDESERTREDGMKIHGLYELIANHFRRHELGWTKADVEDYCKQRFRSKYRKIKNGFSRPKREWELTEDEAADYRRDLVCWMIDGFPNDEGQVGFVPPLHLEDQ